MASCCYRKEVFPKRFDNVHLLLKDVLEDVFEPAVIGLEDGVLGAHVQWPLLADGVLEAAVCEACNRLETAGGGGVRRSLAVFCWLMQQHYADEVKRDQRLESDSGFTLRGKKKLVSGIMVCKKLELRRWDQ